MMPEMSGLICTSDHGQHARHQQLTCLQNLFVARLSFAVHLVDDQVADAGQAQHAHAAVPGHNGFRHRGHAHRVGPDQAQKAHIGRRLERWPGQTDVDTLAEHHVGVRGCLLGQTAKGTVVGRGHVGKARAKLRVIGAAQWVLSGHADQIDVIGDQHQVAGVETGVEAACGIGEDQGRHAELSKDPNRQRHLLHRVALVEVCATLHDDDRLVLQFAHDQPPLMAGDSRDGEMRNSAVAEHGRLVHLVGQGAEPGAKHYRHRGLKAGA